MKNFTILPQTEKNGRDEVEVLCKHVKHFPSMRGGKVTFGKFKFPVLRVLIGDGETEHKITWSNYHNQPLSGSSCGKFIYHWPSKMQHPRLKDVRVKTAKNVTGVWYDTLSEKIEVPGDKKEFDCHAQFVEWMTKRGYIGPVVAEQIMDAFCERIVSVMTAAA